MRPRPDVPAQGWSVVIPFIGKCVALDRAWANLPGPCRACGATPISHAYAMGSLLTLPFDEMNHRSFFKGVPSRRAAIHSAWKTRGSGPLVVAVVSAML